MEQGASTPAQWSPASAADDPFRALAHTTPDAIVTADASNRISYVNPAAERLVGHRAEDLVGQTVGMIIPEELRAAHDAGFARFVTTREGRLVGRTVEVDVLRADGARVPVELSLGFAGSGETVTLTAVMRDISRRVRRQRSMAAQLAVTAAVSGAETSDQEARIVAALGETLAWDRCALWRVEGDRLRLSEVWEADPQAADAGAAASRSRSVGRGEGVLGSVWEAARPTWLDAGEHRPADATAAEGGLVNGVVLPLITEGEVIGVLELLTGTDEELDEDLRHSLATVASQIAESVRRQELAEDLLRSNLDLEHFATVAAHDLAEPLNTIAGFAGLLEQPRYLSALPGDAADFVAAIRTSATQGREVLDSFLRLARAGSQELRLEPVDLGELARDVLLGLDAAIRAGNADIALGPLPTVSADRALLGQVFQNLIANAIKFRGEEDPRISVTATEEAGACRIAVRDNGAGITDGEEVFDLFRRAGTQSHGGAGIGLALCRTIVERHGGTIGFQSSPGQGTTFHVVLPSG